MTKRFEQGHDEIARLCRYFATNRAVFSGPDVNEAQVRQYLIDPLFEALGWDVRNDARVAPQYREVVPEESLDVAGQRKAPDYAFRVGQTPKFYAEAKRCSVNIKDDPAPAFQLRRYGWSARTPLSILTDFEELAVYDCAQKPKPNDKATHARILYYQAEEYPDRWRELWDVFSREAVWAGAFDQYAAAKHRRGASEVDAEFLKEIEAWRNELAKNFALRNPNLTPDELNAAVQRTIDRVVFLRMAEDRGLEPFEQLLRLCDAPDIYARFMNTLCRNADDKYNSGIFHLNRDYESADAPDTLTPALRLDDKVFKPILQKLYFAHGSPYDFGVLPVEILGTVYERFLGKVIRLTPSHQARVEEKPEVRKVGGVYYTPSYIVNYIVNHTVGAHINGKSPKQLAGTKSRQPLRILDMACGSGSFLLGAYRKLLDHALAWYLDHKPENHPAAVHRNPRNNQWQLTITEKKRLLTTHIFGVDIDPQAVEVTKLSLLLKALEGESDATLAQQLQLFHTRALPNLANNIQCGNALIGPDYFNATLLPDADEIKRVNPFDWNTAFPEAMKHGGFDCVIGNPPYIRIQTMKEWAPLEVELYKEYYQAAAKGNYDIYVVFIEQGLKLLNPNGRLGFICPNKFFNAKYGAPIRDLIAKGQHLEHVVHFGDQQIFDGATTYTCLLFLDKAPVKECRYVKVDNLDEWRVDNSGKEICISAKNITASDWNFVSGESSVLYEKLTGFPSKLKDVADRIAQGIRTSANEVYVLDLISTNGSIITAYSKKLDQEVKIEREAVLLFLQGREIKPYRILPSGKVVIMPYTIENQHAALIPEPEIKGRFPLLYEYLSQNKAYLAAREKGRMKGPKWYAYIYPKNIDVMSKPKIIVPDITEKASFAFDDGGDYAFTSGYAITLNSNVLESPKYIIALLNSKILDHYLKCISTTMRGGFFRYFTQFMEQLPIRRIDFTNRSDKAAHEKITTLVDTMLALHKQFATATTEQQKSLIQYQINTTDTKIDQLVYALYGLTDKEIALIEASKK